MAISYRGKNVDMVSLAKKYEKTVALGNAHMNGRGDILGHNGKVVKTREEQLSEYYEGNKFVSETVNLKSDSSKDVEDDLKKIQSENLKKATGRKTPKYTDISEDDKKELEGQLW